MIRATQGILAWASLVLFASAASADGVRIQLNGGVALPVAPAEFTDFWNAGVSVGGGIGVWASPYWEVLGTFHFQHFAADEQSQIDDLLLEGNGVVTEVIAIDGRNAKTVTLTVEARFHVPTSSGSLSPFLAFGTGYFGISTTDARVTPAREDIPTVTVLGDEDNAFGATIGAGLEFDVSRRLRLVVDSIYTIGFTEKVSTQYLPFRLGIVLD